MSPTSKRFSLSATSDQALSAILLFTPRLSSYGTDCRFHVGSCRSPKKQMLSVSALNPYVGLPQRTKVLISLVSVSCFVGRSVNSGLFNANRPSTLCQILARSVSYLDNLLIVVFSRLCTPKQHQKHGEPIQSS